MFKDQVIKSLQDAGVEGEIKLTIPPNPEMGDLSFACFDIAKKENKNPVEIAKEIKSKLKLEFVERAEALGPYVNFYLNAGILAENILKEIFKKDYGTSNIGKGKKVIIEYPSQNTHKEFHIGHLRNVCIGNTLVQLYKKCGFKIIPVNYINDFGVHVVKCLWGILNIQKIAVSNQQPPENKQKWLGEVYAEASKYIKEHEAEIKPELDVLQKKLENHDRKIMKLFKQTRKWSLDGFDKLQKELGVIHKKTFLESEVKEKGQKIVDGLLAKGIAKVGDGGAIIADLSAYGMEIALLRKSTGAGVYMTSDLGLAVEKFKKYKVDESINITGTEQDFYFKQLFKILELDGFKNKMVHVGYGLVNLPDGKMSSRAGNVILYENLRDEINARLKKEVVSRHNDWPKKKQDKTVEILTQAVLKFTMQQHEAAKMIVFDLNQAISFDGFSAPYVLYVVARINSLLKKADACCTAKKLNYGLLKASEEKKLLLLLASFKEAIDKALKSYNPSVITKYCFDVSQAFNEFYNRCSVLNEPDKEISKVRLELCSAVKKVLVEGLDLLTIDTVEEM